MYCIFQSSYIPPDSPPACHTNKPIAWTQLNCLKSIILSVITSIDGPIEFRSLDVERAYRRQIEATTKEQKLRIGKKNERLVAGSFGDPAHR